MRSRADLATDYAEFLSGGRKALLDGHATHDLPLKEGSARWGLATILRPRGAVLDRLATLAKSAALAIGPGHWTHGRDALHFTLRSLERFRQKVPADDPARLAYAAAVREATADLPPVRMELRGVTPHAGGVMVFGYPLDDTVWTLQRRYASALRTRGAGDFESWTRDRWYVSLIHFTRPPTDPKQVVAWCDEHTDLPLGTTEIDTVDLVQAIQSGDRIQLRTLEQATL